MRRQRGLDFTSGDDAGVEWRCREELGTGLMFCREWVACAQGGSMSKEPGGKDDFRRSVAVGHGGEVMW